MTVRTWFPFLSILAVVLAAPAAAGAQAPGWPAGFRQAFPQVAPETPRTSTEEIRGARLFVGAGARVSLMGIEDDLHTESGGVGPMLALGLRIPISGIAVELRISGD